MSNIANLKNNLINSAIWKISERFLVQMVQLVVSIILARIILPQEYGLVAITSSLIAVFDVVIETGFGSALIQKRDLKEIDYDSIYVINVCLSVLLYLMIFILAPKIASLYNNDVLKPLLRVYALSLIINSFVVTRSAKIYREMRFKQQFTYSLIATITSGVLGIILALLRLGPWAVIFQQLSYRIVYATLMIIKVDLRPRIRFSLANAKSLMKFNINILGYNVLNVLYTQAYSLLIAKQYSSQQLAYYSKAEQFPSIIATNSDYALQNILLPGYSMVQEDYSQVKKILRASVKMSSFFLFPAMSGLASIAHPIVLLLLTDKWLPCVPFLQLSCIKYALQPIRTASIQAMNGIGKSKISLKIGLITKMIGIAILGITLRFNVMVVAIGAVTVSICTTIIIMFIANKYLQYSISDQLIDIFPVSLCSIIMLLCINLIGYLNISAFIEIVFKIILGPVMYFLSSLLINKSETVYIANTIRSYIFRKKAK